MRRATTVPELLSAVCRPSTARRRASWKVASSKRGWSSFCASSATARPNEREVVCRPKPVPAEIWLSASSCARWKASRSCVRVP